MRCQTPGCQNVQCYVCSKVCNYDHFDQAGTGRSSSCPLYDQSIHARHQAEAEAAERAATKALLEQNPELDENSLKIRVSKEVEASERKKASHTRRRPRQAPNPIGPNFALGNPMAGIMGPTGPGGHDRPLVPLARAPQVFPATAIDPRAYLGQFGEAVGQIPADRQAQIDFFRDAALRYWGGDSRLLPGPPPAPIQSAANRTNTTSAATLGLPMQDKAAGLAKQLDAVSVSRPSALIQQPQGGRAGGSRQEPIVLDDSDGLAGDEVREEDDGEEPKPKRVETQKAVHQLRSSLPSRGPPSRGRASRKLVDRFNSSSLATHARLSSNLLSDDTTSSYLDRLERELAVIERERRGGGDVGVRVRVNK